MGAVIYYLGGRVPGFKFGALSAFFYFICIPALTTGCCHFRFTGEDQGNWATKSWDDLLGVILSASLVLELIPRCTKLV